MSISNGFEMQSSFLKLETVPMKNPIPRSIWIREGDKKAVEILDQRFLPHKKVVNVLKSTADFERAISDMEVRGAPLIGVTAAFGMYFAVLEALLTDDFDAALNDKAKFLKASRPTAVNLMWAVDLQLDLIKRYRENQDLADKVFRHAEEIMEQDAKVCESIGAYGLELIKEIAKRKGGGPVNVLTHCNAGSLAVVEWGTATAPIYQAHLSGIEVHVWVDETRPRNQGAHLTAWEMDQAGVPHTLLVDNAGGHLMQHGQVDLVLVGCDRVTREGDAANKIGTYLKALAAVDNGVPFYVCLPSSTIDWKVRNGIKEIEIEERDSSEVQKVQGLWKDEVVQVQICPENTPALNIGFDVTPARLITGFITENGICEASEEGLSQLFPELAQGIAV